MSKATAVLAALVVIWATGCTSSSSGSTCTGTSQLCSGNCVEFANDNRNCGACGTTCAAGTVCTAGTCQVTCQAGSVICNGECVDPQTDRAFCGASGACSGTTSGTACGPGQVCSGGTCQLSCQMGLVDCGGTCVNPQNDRAHCGASGTCSGTSAGTACGSGQDCAGGTCVASGTCPSGMVQCSSGCVDPTTDRAHCGASGTCTGASAGTACTSGQVCSGGTCALSCQAGLVNCGGTCVNPSTDRAYCGASGTCSGASAGAVCAAGQVCNAGTCQVSCQAGLVNCGGQCVDPQTSPTHCGASGTCTGASAGAACTASQICSAGACQPLPTCPSGQVLCEGTCIDPLTERTHCGATGACGVGGGSAGATCGIDQTCSAGACTCSAGALACGTSCIDPTLDSQYCGASGNCQGANAGTTCTASNTCVNGTCGAKADIDWRPVPSTVPPHFVRNATTLAHIVFDGTNMVDQCALPGSGCLGHTGATNTGLWTRVGTPPSQPSGMWSPTQHASGPFSTGDYWRADAASKAYLDAETSGEFFICARYKPGRYPVSNPTKIVFANGTPEIAASATPGGWSLMQMHTAFCFHYQDSSAAYNGEWMSTNLPASDSQTIATQEWTWQCGGRDNQAAPNVVRQMWESYTGDMMANGDQPVGATLGSYKPDPDPTHVPTIGAYLGGSNALFDGAVYEIIIKREAATYGNMYRTVARASGGVRAHNSSPVWVRGADDQYHAGAPSTVEVQPGGYINADQTIYLAEALSGSPVTSGECYGMVASSPNWAGISKYTTPLTWYSLPLRESFSHALLWNNPYEMCVNAADYTVVPALNTVSSCANIAPSQVVDNQHYTFLNCFAPVVGAPPTGTMGVYLDGALQGTPAPLSTVDYFPRLDFVNYGTFGPDVSSNASNLRIHRVFACRTPTPTGCR